MAERCLVSEAYAVMPTEGWREARGVREEDNLVVACNARAAVRENDLQLSIM